MVCLAREFVLLQIYYRPRTCVNIKQPTLVFNDMADLLDIGTCRTSQLNSGFSHDFLTHQIGEKRSPG